jgi:NADPH:quinone reductase-like Zn-dependent oxidoreductase
MSTVSIPKTAAAWTVEGKDGFESLKFNKEAPVQEPTANEVLVKFHAASLNFRDLIIPKGSSTPLFQKSVQLIHASTF